MGLANKVLTASLISGALAGSPLSCPSDLPASCQNTTTIDNTCCFIPSGQLLQTQFWDTDPATGPTDSWTIHGLWPDNCDGSYPANCDDSRAYTNLADMLEGTDTLSYMKTYWKDYKGDDESFWEHEWGKHGVCISTLEPGCYSDYTEGEEAVDFFTRTVGLFKTLPTYKWLSDASITPSSSKKYSVDKVQSALSKQHGAEVTLGCEDGALNQVWYHFNVKGSLQNGEFEAAKPDGSKSTCSGEITYKPKMGNSTRRAVKYRV